MVKPLFENQIAGLSKKGSGCKFYGAKG